MKDLFEKLGITPGPLMYKKTSTSPNRLDLLLQTADEAKIIGWIYNDHEADARLMATAPEMFVWIKGMLDCAEKNDMFKAAKLLDLAPELIEKATGKTWEEIKGKIG